MINIKTSNIEIMNKMSKAYSLFIDDYCEKYKKEAINYLKEQIKNINENITKDKDREEQYSILKYKIENKIKSLELFINEEKNNNYIKLINEIFDDRNDYRLNNITKEEEKIIENEIKNENKHIKEKAIKININLVKKGKKLKKETINNLIDNIIQSNEEVQTSNEPDNNSYIQEKIISHISSELISEDLKQKGKCNLDEEMKEKITKGLSIKDKSIRNNLLKIYPHIENLNNNDMEKPMKLIENNIIYENDRNIFDNSVEILNNFLEKNRNMKVNSELTNGLIEYISENDYNVYNEENKKIDDEYEDKKNIFEKIKDEVDKEVRKQLIETLKINDEKTKIELKKHFKKKKLRSRKKATSTFTKRKKKYDKKNFPMYK